MPQLLILILLLCAPLRAADPVGNFPLTLLCLERVLSFAELASAPNEDPRLQRLRAGVERLRQIEAAGKTGGFLAWKDTEVYFHDPVLLVEIQALLHALLKLHPPQSFESTILTHLHESARKKLMTLVGALYSRYNLVAPADPLRDPNEVDRLASRIVQELNDPDSAARETAITALVVRVSDAEGIEALVRATYQLNLILATLETAERLRLAALTRRQLAGVYLKVLMETNRERSEEALGLLTAWSGGNAGTFLWDLEARREGTSPLSVLGTLAQRTGQPDVTNTQALADARANELQAGLAGRRLVPPFVLDLLRQSLQWRPLHLPDGTPLVRLWREIDEQNLVLLNGLGVDDRGLNDEALQAVDSALQLIGDPRVDAESLRDWGLSLLGDRRSFAPDQYVRFLQEANAILPLVHELGAGRTAVISREHRKYQGEELGPSFDLWILESESRTVVEAIEVKQTDRPKQANQIGGILRQATQKLDGELVTPPGSGQIPTINYSFAADSSQRNLRNLQARKTLVIQIPWEAGPTSYRRGGLTLVQRPDGIVEKWRGDKVGEAGGLLGEEDLFTEVARHLPKVADTDYFHEIRLTDLEGKILARFHHERDDRLPFNSPHQIEGVWRLVRSNP